MVCHGVLLSTYACIVSALQVEQEADFRLISCIRPQQPKSGDNRLVMYRIHRLVRSVKRHLFPALFACKLRIKSSLDCRY
ncbi:unnamed protein product [Protopolystoma xenopodis]|uniref:Secreted protein n=1 Tax=Protopolystoma xenopodis TaxID=117903 RepID=A0A3S5AP03_9PLAT|nr:unnamed protein product [Protopolystoma xenopodis]